MSLYVKLVYDVQLVVLELCTQMAKDKQTSKTITNVTFNNIVFLSCDAEWALLTSSSGFPLCGALPFLIKVYFAFTDIIAVSRFVTNYVLKLCPYCGKDISAFENIEINHCSV